MTVLVTGGAGYIGSHMVHELADAGERVVVLDNLSTGFDWAVAKGVPLIVGETGDQALVARLIREHGVDAIIHFAASIVVPDSVRDPLGYYRNNTMNSRALIECAVNGGVRHFIFSSTAAVYGNPTEIPVKEDSATLPISPYGWSKLMTEIMLRDAGNAYGLQHVILRYFNVAGADPQRRTGQSTKAATHLIKVAVETVLGLRPKLDVFGDDYPTPDGTCIRDYIHVSDLVRAHADALRYLRVGRAVADAQLRLRPRLLGSRSDRSGQARLGRRLQGRHRAAPGGRPGANCGALRTGAQQARLAAALRRPFDHRARCAWLGTRAYDAPNATSHRPGPQSRRLSASAVVPARPDIKSLNSLEHPAPSGHETGSRRVATKPAAVE